MLDSLFNGIFSCDTREAQDMAAAILKGTKYKVQRGKKYCYGEGDIPVLLVAHTDTVHISPPRKIYHDPAQNVAWSPDGIGADDRAGVYAIARILLAGFRPHVLFTDEEETGGAGADEASVSIFPNVRCLIQLDRMNADDSVYYSCDNKKFRRWVNRFGWKTAPGSFTDISILMPAWGIAGVNLSVGYYRQHSSAEHVRLNELENTISRVQDMLQNVPQGQYRYRAKRERRIDSWPDNWGIGKRTYYSHNLMDNPIPVDETESEEYQRLQRKCDQREDDLDLYRKTWPVEEI